MRETLKLTLDGDIAVFRVCEEFNEVIGLEIRNAFLRAMEAGARGAVIDISALSMLASVGIGAMISVNASALNREARVIFVITNPFVLKTLAMTRVNRILSITDTVERAREMVTEK